MGGLVQLRYNDCINRYSCKLFLRRQYMKRILSLLAAVAIAIGLMAGCGDSGDTASTNSTNPDSSVST